MEQPLSDEGFNWMVKSYTLFPDWSTEQRIRWARAKEYVVHRFVFPIGEKAVDRAPPDFLRALPRPQQLWVKKCAGDYIQEARRLIESKLA